MRASAHPFDDAIGGQPSKQLKPHAAPFLEAKFESALAKLQIHPSVNALAGLLGESKVRRRTAMNPSFPDSAEG